MNKYLSFTRNDFFSFLIIFPLIVSYELLAYINNFQSNIDIRNGADVYIRNMFHIFGEYANFMYAAGLLFFLLFIFLKHKQSFLSSEINLLFLFLMIIESCFHALALLFILDLTISLNHMISNPAIERVYLSIGAGIWEEILFRYGLISLLLFLFSKILKKISFWDYVIIIVTSSYIFSIYHFIGPFGETPELYSLIYRFIAGLILCLIFIFRGLGITVYTHAFFNLYLTIFSISK